MHSVSPASERSWQRASAPVAVLQFGEAESASAGDEQVEHAQHKLRQLVSPGNRLITFVRRWTSSSERSSRCVQRSRLRRRSGYSRGTQSAGRSSAGQAAAPRVRVLHVGDQSPQPGLSVRAVTALSKAGLGQYSFLISKKEPRIVPASLDFCLANLNREASSAGTSIPSESLNPTARFVGASTVYITLIDRPLS